MSLDELIAAAGLAADSLAGGAYICADPTAFLMPLHEISRRLVPLVRDRLESLLYAIANDVPLPPISVRPSRLLLDGHHRIAVSEALGAATVPVIRRP